MQATAPNWCTSSNYPGAFQFHIPFITFTIGLFVLFLRLVAVVLVLLHRFLGRVRSGLLSPTSPSSPSSLSITCSPGMQEDDPSTAIFWNITWSSSRLSGGPYRSFLHSPWFWNEYRKDINAQSLCLTSMFNMEVAGDRRQIPLCAFSTKRHLPRPCPYPIQVHSVCLHTTRRHTCVEGHPIGSWTAAWSDAVLSSLQISQLCCCRPFSQVSFIAVTGCNFLNTKLTECSIIGAIGPVSLVK